MAPTQSNLTSEKYGYDVVVSTTQESINAGLVQYLQNSTGKQPVSYLCFLADDKGEPTTEKSLEEIIQLSGGVDPFQIPSDTKWTDDRIQKLFRIRFVCAIRLQAGIPPGLVKNVPGKGPQLQLPQPIVTLGNTSDNVLFNMYCSDITVIKNTPGGGWSDTGSWKWYNQQPGQPWYIQTRTSLLVADLDKSLNTTYFNNHPEERDALRAQLVNLSGSAFSLQQLFFNLDSAVVQTSPDFQGVDDKAVNYLLGISFKGLWSKIAKERGLPLIGITAVAQQPDGSPLRLTGLERWVSPVVDPLTGIKLSDPSKEQLAATTLNYLCAADGHPMRGAANFTWNWVEPQDIAQSSGVIAIKRSTIARYLVNQMLPRARLSCIEPWTKVEATDVVGNVKYWWNFTPGQEPAVNISDSGPLVATLTYSKEARASDKNAATYGELNITSSYTCTIVFGSLDFSVFPPKYIGGNKFTIMQNLKISVYNQWAATSSSANVIDNTLQDEYVIFVDDHGSLTSSPTGVKTVTDNSQAGDRSAFVNFWTGVNDLIDSIKEQSGNFLNSRVKPIPFDEIKNFVFPGGKVFTYKTAQFSNYQDLISLITYVNPTVNQFKPMTMSMRTKAMIREPEVVEIDKLPPLALFVEATRAQGLLGPQLVPHQTDDHAMKTLETTGISFDGSPVGIASGENGVTIGQNINGTATHPPSASVAAVRSSGDGMQLSSSTDMMLNYVQGELVQPEGKFRALQMDDGNALLFAIDSSGTFNVIRELVGQTQTGWVVNDISSSIIKQKFPSGGKVRAFDVAQSVMGVNTIGLGMSVRVDNSDTLFLSLLNSPNSTSSWVSNPTWHSFPFDAKDRPSSVQITNIYFSETDQNQQYIMVDILRDPTSPLKDTARYIVDPFSDVGPYWMPHKLPFDVEEGTYQSCMGRVSGALIDGIYTSGTVKGAGQLAYVPLFNLSGNAAPMPTRLLLPGKIPATAIASARNDWNTSAMYGTTDLYAVGASTLYRWDPDQQLDDDTVGTPILTSDVFAGTDMLVALTRNRVTTVFGKNASNVVYYTSCPVEKLSNPQSWGVPVPTLNGIERITSYINVRDGGNTVYAAGGNKIQQVIQASNTSSKIWQAQGVTLAASPQSRAMEFKSYTTTIKTSGSDGMPAAGAQVTLTTQYRTPVYIHGLYYVLSKIPVTVAADPTGQVTVIQATESLVGAVITAKLGNVTETINPMEKSFAKLAALTDKDSLRGAQITVNTTAGGVVGPQSTASLVSSSVSDNDLQAVADGIQKLKAAYDSQNTAAPVFSQRVANVARMSNTVATKPTPMNSMNIDLAGGIVMAAGDLFNWLKTGVQSFIDVVKDAITGAWNFIVKIAGKVYHAILDTAEAVLGALEWVFNQIKTGIQDLIRYIEFLFEWDNIRRTKDIMHNLVKYYLKDMVSGIRTIQSQFDNSITDAQKAVAKWTGIKDWTPLGDGATKPPRGNALNPTKDQTPSSQMLANHFQNQAQNMTITSELPEVGLVQNLIDDLMNAVASEGEVFQQTFDQLKALASDFMELSLADILKRLAGILVEAVLGTAQVVVDALFNVLYHVADAALGVLDTKIHIPIISDILNAIGVPDISFLDLITWIGAAGVTIVYKIANGRAPFPDDATSRALVQAQDWNSFAAVMRQGEPSKVSTMSMRVSASASANAHKPSAMMAMPIVSGSAGSAIYVAGHAIAGFIAFTGNFLFFAEAMDTSPTNTFGLPSAVMGIIGAVAARGAAARGAQRPNEPPALAARPTAPPLVTVASKLVFSGPGQKYLATGKLSFLKANDNRKVGTVINSILVLPALSCTCFHFYELSQKSESKERSCAIVGETSSMVQYLGRVSYTVALLDPDLETRAIPAGVMAASNVVMCGLETACAVIV